MDYLPAVESDWDRYAEGNPTSPSGDQNPTGEEVWVQTMKVREMMVPLEEYAAVSENATMFDAVVALEKAQREFDKSRYRHRAILVLNDQKNVVGKVSQLDLLKALEFNFDKVLDAGALGRTGVSLDLIESISRQGLSGKPLDDLCRKAGELSVRDFMYSPLEGEFIGEDASLNQAVHRLIVGQHHSLLVTRGKEIVGVLRLTDVFKLVSERILACRE
jgi:CBS domain-containing protein